MIESNHNIDPRKLERFFQNLSSIEKSLGRIASSLESQTLMWGKFMAKLEEEQAQLKQDEP